ncbi:MAG: hexokinase [Actinobacteria bacterium]|nr:hexokinase [Actinomycetota bacterium]
MLKNSEEVNIKKIKGKVSDFLNKYGMNYETIDIQKYVDIFLEEMHRGLKGYESSLKMLPTFIEVKNKIPLNKPAIVLDAGGTNFRSAVVKFHKDYKPVIENYNHTVMPGFKEEISKEAFFRNITGNIKGFLDKSNNIGFVFSYPMEIFPNRDGKLINFTKEIKVKKMEGEFIGENLLAEIKKLGFYSNKKIILLNDANASLLAGLYFLHDRQYDSFIGLILGTGFNVSYMERNSNINKSVVLKSSKNEYQIINVEAGAFSKGPLGEIDYYFDSKTKNPGSGIYEKMLSGAYMGGLAAELVRFGKDSNLFTGSFSSKIGAEFILDSSDLDDYLLYPPKNETLKKLLRYMSREDKVVLYYLFENLVERAAILTSIVLASCIIKSAKGKNPCNPVCIVAEGNSFYKLKDFKSRVEFYMKNIFNKRGSYYYEINKIENAIMVGGAAAGLSV